MNFEKNTTLAIHPVCYTGLFTFLFLTLALGGCSNTSKARIEASDFHVFTPELRMAHNFDEEEQSALPHTGHAIEIRATNTKGSSTQTLNSGQSPLVLDYKNFTAPQQINYEFNFAYGDIAWRWRKFFKDRKLGMEVTAGAGFASVNLQATSASQSASQRFENLGARVSVGPIFRISPSSSLQANVMMFYAPLAFTGIHDAQRYELVYAKAFEDNFRVRAGYARWHIVGYNDFQSDFVVDFTGPVLALDLEF